MAYPPLRPSPEPLDWCVVCCENGVINQISEAMTFGAARAYQIKYGSDDISTKIVKKSTAASLKEGMLSTAILDVLKSQLDRGYSILLDQHHRLRF
jgi:hypothetical protein